MRLGPFTTSVFWSIAFVATLATWSIPLYCAEKQTIAANRSGSAWVIAPHFVITNNHVVGDIDVVKLTRLGGVQMLADVVMRDTVNDVVLLKPRNIALLPAALPLANRPSNVGAQVFTVGYPLVDVMGSEPKMTMGYVNARTGMANDPRMYQISVPIQPGNSGGPVLNMKGEVIGIATSSLNANKIFNWTGNLPQNVNYAIKPYYVRALLDTVVSDGPSVKLLPSINADLEKLIQRVRASVLLVTANDQEQYKLPKVDRGTTHNVTKTAVNNPKQNLSLYVYTKPSNYDLRNNVTNETLSSYSKKVSDLVTQHLKLHTSAKITISENKQARQARELIRDIYNAALRKRYCKRAKLDYIFTVENDTPTSMGLQEIKYRIHDCRTDAFYYRTYNISITNAEDFDYKTDIHKRLRDFFADLPRQVRLPVDYRSSYPTEF